VDRAEWLNQMATFLGVIKSARAGCGWRHIRFRLAAAAGTGDYTLSIQSNQIADAAGNFYAATVLTLDTIAPTATENARDRGGNRGQLHVHVEYSDNDGIDASTIDSTDLGVTGPFGYNSAATLIGTEAGIIRSRPVLSDRQQLHVLGWSGGWDLPITMQPNAVKDVRNSLPLDRSHLRCGDCRGTFATSLNLGMIAGVRTLKRFGRCFGYDGFL